MGATQAPEELYKQCLDVWEQRKRFLLAHYFRDHVKFVQHAEKSAVEAQKAQAFMGTPDGINKRLNEVEVTKTKTRSTRKRSSAIKKEVADAMEE
jgi:hypothetical protein